MSFLNLKFFLMLDNDFLIDFFSLRQKNDVLFRKNKLSSSMLFDSVDCFSLLLFEILSKVRIKTEAKIRFFL